MEPALGSARPEPLPCMAIAGPGGVDDAIAAGLDLDGTPIPAEMISLTRR